MSAPAPRHPDAPLPCIVCDRAVEQVDRLAKPGTNQPWNATSFSTSGHYGSTVWDEMKPWGEADLLEINICDDCLIQKGREGKVGVQKAPDRAVTYPPLVLWRDFTDLDDLVEARKWVVGEDEENLD